MSTVLLQSESEEKLQSIVDFAEKQGVVSQTFYTSSLMRSTTHDAEILRGGDGKSIVDPESWQSETRSDRH